MKALSILALALCCSSWLFFLKTYESWFTWTFLAAKVAARSWLSVISALNSASLLSSWCCVPFMADVSWANWLVDTSTREAWSRRGARWRRRTSTSRSDTSGSCGRGHGRTPGRHYDLSNSLTQQLVVGAQDLEWHFDTMRYLKYTLSQHPVMWFTWLCAIILPILGTSFHLIPASTARKYSNPGLLRTGAIANNIYKCIGQATSIRAMFEIAPLVSPAFRAHNYLMLQSRKWFQYGWIQHRVLCTWVSKSRQKTISCASQHSCKNGLCAFEIAPKDML